MKYTKNFPLKLKNLGFSFVGNNDDCKDDEDLSYEVWRKGEIEVTIEHSPTQAVYAYILCGDLHLNCSTLEELKILDKMLNTQPKWYKDVVTSYSSLVCNHPKS